MSYSITRSLVAVLFFIQVFFGQLMANNEVSNNRIYFPQTAVGGVVHVEDNKFGFMYSNTSTWQQEFNDRSVTNSIELGIDHEYLYKSIVPYQVETQFDVVLDITYQKWDGASFVTELIEDVSLQITYDPNRKTIYKDKDIFRFHGGYSVDVVVKSSNLPAFVYIENKVEIDRYYSYNPSSVPDGNAFGLNAGADGKLNVDFPYVKGASAYDLEWAYVENLSTTNPIADVNLFYDFKNNATRVRLVKNSFEFPMVYNPGYLIFRYRPVYFHEHNGSSWKFDLIKEGRWSTELTQNLESGTIADFKGGYTTAPVYNINTWYDSKKNWGYTANYAEKGRSNQAIVYSDGLVRSRQSLVALNTQEKVMANAPVFDAEGRTPISVLPVPVDQQNLSFIEWLNTSTNGTPYHYTDFDTDQRHGGSCDYNYLEMDQSLSTGAANYYSTNNPNKQGTNAFIPDAKGTPFGIVQYMPDQTGRIKTMSGGVGKGFEWKSGRELQFHYGSVTNTDLEELFVDVNRVSANQYDKTIVIDQNGQWSKVYKDPSGRVVASMLTGETPENLVSVGNGQSVSKVTDLTKYSDNGLVNEINVKYEVLAEANKTYTLSYNLTEQEATYYCQNDVGQTNGICYQCFYEVEFLVEQEDPCNSLVPIVHNVSNLLNTTTNSSEPLTGTVQVPLSSDVAGYTDACDGAYASFTFSGPNGTVEINSSHTSNLKIIKRLILKDDAKTAIVEDFKNKVGTNGCIESIEDRMNLKIDEIKDDIYNCSFDPCLECETIFKSTYSQYQTAVIDKTTPDLGLTSESQWQQAKSDCLEASGCPGSNLSSADWCSRIRVKIKNDLLPGGEFGAIDAMDPNWSQSIYNVNNTIGVNYLTNGIVYTDILGVAISPDPKQFYTSMLDFTSNFEIQWTTDILNYIEANPATNQGFPGLCFLQQCSNPLIQDYFDFEQELLDVSTASGAISKGWFNGIGVAPHLLNGDIYTSNTSFNSKIDDYDGTTSLYKYVSDFVTGGSQTEFTFFNSANCQEDREWLMFRTLYIKERQEAIINEFFSTCSYGLSGSNLNDYNFVNDSPFQSYIDWANNYPNGGTNPGQTNQTNFCTTQCTDKAAMWINDNLDCASLLNVTEKAALEADLIAFCQAGCDGINQSGVYVLDTPVTLSSAGSVSTIDQVLTYHFSNAQASITYPSTTCNKYLLDGMQSKSDNFDVPVLDACGCQKFFDNEAMHSSNNPNNLTEQELFEQTYGLFLEDFDALKCACTEADANGDDVISDLGGGTTELDNLLNQFIVVVDELSCVDCITSEVLFGTTSTVGGYELGYQTAVGYINGDPRDETYYDGFSQFLKDQYDVSMISVDLELFYEEYLQYIQNQKIGPSNLYPQAYSIQVLLNDLITRGEFTSTSFVFPWFHSYYRGNLFPYNFDTDITVMGSVDYQANVSGNTMTIDLVHGGVSNGNAAFTHSLTLSKSSSTFSFSDVVNIENIYADLSAPSVGDQYKFILDVAVLDNSGNISYHDITGTASDFIIYRAIENASTSGYTLKWCENRFADVKENNPCLDEVILVATTEVIEGFMDDVDQEVALFADEYERSCMQVSETFTLTYPEKDYATTLYYYTIDGNLVQTVPPIGVDKVNQQHSQKTQYQYTTLNQLSKTISPDGGVSEFWYSDNGRLLLSQNAKQKVSVTNSGYASYSYTKYDYLGRIVEVGEMSAGAQTSGGGAIVAFDALTYEQQLELLNASEFPEVVPSSSTTSGISWLIDEKREVTQTFYSSGISGVNAYFENGQRNLRNRIASVTYQEEFSSNTSIYDHASHFTYDIHGNVETLIQENKALESVGQSLKTIDYDYDLLSGNVNQIIYQKEMSDQFIHKYEYDADNRLNEVFTSSDGVTWSRDADYKYYEHGPLARIELGEHKVQGVDFAYNLQGWLKGVNSGTLDPLRDIGKDGANGVFYDVDQESVHLRVARDIYGFTLDYYNNDALSMFDGEFIDNGKEKFMPIQGGAYETQANDDLYNGNIKGMIVSLTDDEGNPLDVHARGYVYDQLNRLKSQKVFTSSDIQSSNSLANATYTDDYYADFSYDENGKPSNSKSKCI